MRILGIDPGATVGWCVYDAGAARVLDHGEADVKNPVACANLEVLLRHWAGATVAIERPRVYSGRDKDGQIKHAAGNDVADTCEQAGWLTALAGGSLAVNGDLGHGAWRRGQCCYLLERRAVTWAMRRHFGEPVVGDGPIWKALRDAHGGTDAMQGPKKGKPATRTRPAEPDREPGHLHGMGGHARAAFAVAWACAQLLDKGGK